MRCHFGRFPTFARRYLTSGPRALLVAVLPGRLTRTTCRAGVARGSLRAEVQLIVLLRDSPIRQQNCGGGLPLPYR
jgi:hypothetical protein